MRKVDKSRPPNKLTHYESKYPNDTWKNFRDFNGGLDSTAIKKKLFDEQYDLCAYCEVDLSLADSTVNNPAGIFEHHRRVEHFKSKSGWKLGDHGINWSLDWDNVIGVCIGGTDNYNKNLEDFSMSENKSCDAYKEFLESKSKNINKDWHGNVLFPVYLPRFHQLFTFNKATGELNENVEYCSKLSFIKNNHPDTASLVRHTINSFNLNCERLNKARLQILYDFERAKKRARDSGNMEKFKFFLCKWGVEKPKLFQTTRDILISESPIAVALLKDEN
ncbi:retron Ec78 anti-phage system effector HNH endonuclease PtuB [Colwellia polaris]|jgi:uncharacterized protein (TIGR02646 family)|uniref:retron Ec78 anti-phage system effector HNH endonuclease PtuB n=1 Tax=Colwellia polaris TaxID=326537 RepID=UPI000A170D7A|nr:retron Ec78 anti-phage system effector HNH endonuclease PtuB [Colwellia polaris]|tara:strand:- start:3000 stop:3830 length:831 start_codon:yes stop_codon:yes gene_type:complete